jgi:hypothetical protein
MNRAGQSRRGQLAPAGRGGVTADGEAVPAGSAEPGEPSGSPRPGRLAATSDPVARHLALLACYLAAGIALTLPRVSYLWQGRLPSLRDAASYVWDMWWTAHQIVHLSNPFYTGHMAAPAGIQLGFDTTMPLAGLIMTPVTLALGPSASFSLLVVIAPGLACYLMYRVARLWLAAPGAIAAGALFGLSSMLAWQDWYHLNIALGTLFLPATLEAAVRLRRAPSRGRGLILGAVAGACVLVNQESAVLAGVLAALTLLPWLAVRPQRRLVPLAAAAAAAVVVASPQLAAMAQQYLGGGAAASPHLLAHTGTSYGVGPAYLFAPSQRVASYGLTGLARATVHNAGSIGEGMPMFGVVLTVLALCGLAVSWRRRSAWLLAALWLGCAALALGPTLRIGKAVRTPVPGMWHGERVSLVLPYTWLMRVPVLADLREADRFALLGLLGAAMLAGGAVEWLYRRARPTVVVIAVLAVLEAGWGGGYSGSMASMRTSWPALDGPIAADHSQSVVVDVPFGLRGGIPLYGGQMAPQALVMATADGHPRAISYTSWVPANTIREIKDEPFYHLLVRNQNYRRGKPLVVHGTPAELQQARLSARQLHVGWVILWHDNPLVVRYLEETGFRFAYRADGASVYRPAS